MEVRPGVSRRLNSAIEAKGWSARRFLELMKKCDVPGANPPSILSYRRGKVTPPLEFLLSAAAVLEVRPAWLVLGEGEVTEEDEARADRPSGYRIRITRELDDAMKTAFPPLPRLNRVSSAAVWELWTCLRRKAFPPAEETRAAWEASALTAADALGKMLSAPLDAWGGKPDDLEPYELDSYVLMMTRAILCLVPHEHVRECFAKPVLQGAQDVRVVRTSMP